MNVFIPLFSSSFGRGCGTVLVAVQVKPTKNGLGYCCLLSG